MQRAKIVQVVAVPKGESGSGVSVIALDENGRLWATYSNNVPGGEGNWNQWHKLPLLPEGSNDPMAMFK